jgi:hypothetical protein
MSHAWHRPTGVVQVPHHDQLKRTSRKAVTLSSPDAVKGGYSDPCFAAIASSARSPPIVNTLPAAVSARFRAPDDRSLAATRLNAIEPPLIILDC